MLQVKPMPVMDRLPPQQTVTTGRLIIPRPRLVARLEAATRCSRLVLITAEAGAGKTSLVASWAGQAGPETNVSWRSLSDVDALEVLDRLPYEESGLRPGDDLLDTFDRRVVVLDGFPADADRHTRAALGRLMQRIGPRVCMVLICDGAPRLDNQRLGISAEELAIEGDELAMNKTEIAALLTRHAIDPEPRLVEGIWHRTHGWAWGVRRAAATSSRAGSMADQLRAVDQAVADYLETSVLPGLSTAERQVLSVGSVLEQVRNGLTDGVGQLDPATTRRSRGFVRTHADGSFTLHPLLRRHLLHLLRHDVTAGHVCWRSAARVLVDDLRVLGLLTSTTDPLFELPDVLDSLGATQPSLLAAAALARGWPDLAARALEPDGRPAEASFVGSVTAAARLGDTLVRMALARWQGHPDTGLEHHRQALALLPQLGIAQRTAHPALMPLLYAHQAAFVAAGGAPDEVRSALERGAQYFRARAGRGEPGVHAAAAECLGQLAWWQARAGELTDAARHATDVLADPQHSCSWVALAYARLAAVWCHLSRGEIERAVEMFRSTADSHPSDSCLLPELVAASELTAARLAACGAPVVAGQPTVLGWYEHELRIVHAEAELDAGAPAAALAVLSESTPTSGTAQVLRARAAIQLGDVAGAAAAMRRRSVEAVTLQCQIQLELVEAWLAHARHDRVRERSLVDRVLRAASREQLRTPLGWAKPWLHDVITADPELLRRHGRFLASTHCTQHEPEKDAETSRPVTPLTPRELDILQRLGAMRTNEEIGADLFLSANTVKSHLKSLFRKLEVTRRSDAFRRGRALGLC